jgi:hypothetical protein
LGFLKKIITKKNRLKMEAGLSMAYWVLFIEKGFAR